MSADRLVVLLGGRVAGTVTRERGELSLVYEEAWRNDPLALPISLSLPLTTARHGHAAVLPVLQGLLPDDPAVLHNWGRRFHVSPHNPFGMLAEIGEDCAGALQFARVERLDGLLRNDAWRVKWIDEGDVEARLRALRLDSAAWHGPRADGRFSLAGTQPKLGLFIDKTTGRVGVPSGRAPTTHIVKPPLTGFEGLAENEHVCLELARAVGLPAAASRVMRFGAELAIVVERFDRVWVDGPGAAVPVVRVHQEDLCQALGVAPTSKYQNEGGPSPADMVGLLRDHSSRPADDIRTFTDALLFNWLIAGTDAHAKNYSLLHAAGGRTRLAPLYDLASAAPYGDMDPLRIQLAMRIGGKYRIADIRARHWRKLAEELALDDDELIARAVNMAVCIPSVLTEVLERARGDGLDLALIARIRCALEARAAAGHHALRTG